MSVKQIDKTLRGLPLNDKIGCLIVHLCARNVDSIAAIGGLIATASIIGKNLPDEFDRRLDRARSELAVLGYRTRGTRPAETWILDDHEHG